MEPSESPGEPKPCREEISALLREKSVKTNAAVHSENSDFSCDINVTEKKIGNQQSAVQTVPAEETVFRLQTHQQGCRRWACLSTPGPVGLNWGW